MVSKAESAKSFWSLPQNWIIFFLLLIIAVFVYHFVTTDKAEELSAPSAEIIATKADTNFSSSSSNSSDSVSQSHQIEVVTKTRYVFEAERKNFQQGLNKEGRPIYIKDHSPQEPAVVVIQPIVVTQKTEKFSSDTGSSLPQPKKADVIIPLPEMVWIPAGEFEMGKTTKNYSIEQPVHHVHISSFSISKYEITLGQYYVYLTAIGVEKPQERGVWAQLAMVNVSWHDAVAYTKWLSTQTGKRYRLPTEAEWEYAARAHSETDYFWGNQVSCKYARFNGGEGSACDPGNSVSVDLVGSYKPNNFGLYDMNGNVAEWTQDCHHDNYDGAPEDGSAWLTGNCLNRMVRGGSWVHFEQGIRSAARLSLPTFMATDYVGFRVVLEN